MIVNLLPNSDQQNFTPQKFLVFFFWMLRKKLLVKNLIQPETLFGFQDIHLCPNFFCEQVTASVSKKSNLKVFSGFIFNWISFHFAFFVYDKISKKYLFFLHKRYLSDRVVTFSASVIELLFLKPLKSYTYKLYLKKTR